MSEKKIEIGQRLLRLRKAIKKSQVDVADYLGLTVAAYQNYETGRREANYDTLSKLADFYGVTTDYLLGRPGAEPPADPVEEFTDRIQMQEQEQILLKKWLALDEKKRRAVFDFMVDIVHEYEAVQSTAQRHIEKSDNDSKLAIARSGSSDFLEAPDEEAQKTFTAIEQDSDF